MEHARCISKKMGSVLRAALVGNLGGLSSFLLSLDGGDLAGKSRVDVLIPVNGYKRAYNRRTGYGQLPVYQFKLTASAAQLCVSCRVCMQVCGVLETKNAHTLRTAVWK